MSEETMKKLAAEFRAWVNSTETEAQVDECTDFINESGVTTAAQATVAAAWWAGRTSAPPPDYERMATDVTEVVQFTMGNLAPETFSTLRARILAALRAAGGAS